MKVAYRFQEKGRDRLYVKKARYEAVWHEEDAGGYVVMVQLDDFHARRT